MNRKITTNFIFNLTYNIFDIIVPFLVIPYISRIISPDQMGDLSNSQALFGILIVLAGFGIENYSERQASFIAKEKDTPAGKEKISIIIRETFSTTFFTQLLFQLSSIIAILLFVKSPTLRILHIINTFLFLREGLDITWFYTSKEDFKTTTYRNFIARILSVILIFLLVKKPEHLLIYATFIFLPKIISNILLYIDLKKYLGDFKFLSYKWVNFSLISFGIPYLLPFLVLALMERISTIIVYEKIGNYQAGIFDQAIKLIKIFRTLFFSFVVVVRPRMTSFFGEDNKDMIKNYYHKSLNFLVFLGFLLSTGIVVVGKDFVNFFYDPNYRTISVLLLYLIPYLFFLMLELSLNNLLIVPSGDTRLLLKANIISLLSIIILNLVLIPKYNTIGSAISLGISTLISVIYRVYNKREFIYIKDLIWLIIKLLITSGFSIIITLYLKNNLDFSSLINFLAFGSISISIYGIITFIFLKTFRNTFIDLVKDIINNRKKRNEQSN